jgi:glutamate:GABA antiporter
MAPLSPAAPPQLPRVMRLRDVVLFNITAIVGLRWLTTAASQFGLAALGLWLVAMTIFFLPSALAVRELADIDPGAGGIYRWVRSAFGPVHGFVAGWGYWVNNLFYFPSLLVATAAIAAYAAGPRFVHLGDDNRFIAAVSLAGLWIAVGMNLVGLRIGKHLQNLGGIGTWLPALIFVLLAVWSLGTRGSATAFTARGLLPATLDLQSINLFATMTFAFAGLELAPTLGDEIHDPAATLRRGIVLSGLAVVAMYVLGTAAMLVALPHEVVSITNGMPQATAALVERVGASWLAPVAAIVAVLLVIGNLGGVGAWLAGSARLPFVAGVDGALPPAFGRIHPRWQTPYVALLTQGAIATLFVVASLLGTTVKNAYLVLTQTTLILFFIPYLYLFLAYLRLRRRRTAGTSAVGVVGFGAVLFSIVLGFVVPADEAQPWLYEAKVVGGVVGFMALGVWLAARGVRHDTATTLPNA